MNRIRRGGGFRKILYIGRPSSASAITAGRVFCYILGYILIVFIINYLLFSC